MGIETLIEKHATALDKNTAMLTELLAELKSNTGIMNAMNEGRNEALEALTAKDGDVKQTRKPRAKKAEPEQDAPDEQVPAVDEPAAAKWSPDTSVDGLRAVFGNYLTKTDDADEKKERVGKVNAILQQLGVQAINPIEGKKALETDDEKRQAVFFVTRYAAGLPVDFNADYDFDEDPLTQGVAPADDDLVG